MALTASLAIAAASAAIQVAQAQQAARARNKANNAAYAAQAKQVALAQKIQERRRKQALKQETATRRAAFGAHGTGSATGSSAAVLRGLKTESARQGEEAALNRQAGLSASLVNTQNSNRLALLEADQKSQSAAFGAIAKGLTAGASEYSANRLNSTAQLKPQPARTPAP